MRYAQRVNKLKNWKGHVWQGRYFSSPLDDDYTWAAIRYVERNPVRAKLSRKAEKYRWSSAAGHCRLVDDPVITRQVGWQKQFNGIGDWSAWLAEGDNTEEMTQLRHHVDKGLPCGSETFIRKLERLAGRALSFKPQGRPKRVSDNE